MLDMTTIALLAGPQFLGICFNWALLGVLNLQVYLYYDYFPKDRRSLKCLVYGVFIYEWVQTGLITAAAFDIYVYGYGDMMSLLLFHNTWFSATIMCGIISATVQIFFAWRIYRLSRSPTLAGSIIILALLQGIACIVCGAMEKAIGVASAIQGKVLTVSIVWLSGTVVVDVLIAVSMTILLLKSKTGLALTDDLINRMIRLVVETGALTASLSVLVLITANVRPLHETLVYQAPALILTKMYSNTFLTNLNSREYMRRRNQSVVELMPMSGLQFAANVTTQQVTAVYESSGGETASTPVMAHKSYLLRGALVGLEKGMIGNADPKVQLQRRRNSII